MHISLDTNVWMFGIVAGNPWCKTILFSLRQFDVTLADQVRAELERNLSVVHMREFYQFVVRDGVRIDPELIPLAYITTYEQRGLKKGDAVIGAFCEWRSLLMFLYPQIGTFCANYRHKALFKLCLHRSSVKRLISSRLPSSALCSSG